MTPADPLTVVFTSGTTADPKAVIHSQGSVLRKTAPVTDSALNAMFGGRVLSLMPFFWVGGMQEVFAALQSGAALLVLETTRCHRGAGTRQSRTSDESDGQPAGAGFAARRNLRRTGHSHASAAASAPVGGWDKQPGWQVDRGRHDRDIRPLARQRLRVPRCGPHHRTCTGRRRDRRVPGARLRPHAGSLQAGARGDLHRGRFLPHRRSRLRRTTAWCISPPDSRT